jgi:two-component system, chemotaxis family, chemotaxis protein CheY
MEEFYGCKVNAYSASITLIVDCFLQEKFVDYHQAAFIIIEEELDVARILIVDDAKFMRMTLFNILQKANHEVVGEAENGVEAVELFEKEQPDLVTMDITMPEKNGIEALKKIIQKDSNAKIIMCSALGQQKVVVEAIEAGAKDFIVKPFDENRVLEAVNRVLG